MAKRRVKPERHVLLQGDGGPYPAARALALAPAADQERSLRDGSHMRRGHVEAGEPRGERAICDREGGLHELTRMHPRKVTEES